MRVQIDTQLFRALDHILAIDASGEGFVLELLAYAGRSTSAIALEGLTSVQAVRNPESSSQAKST